MKLPVILVSVLAVLSLASGATQAAPVAVATWNFDNTLAADEAGAPALTPIDPLGLNSFMTDTVFGETRQVYRFDGNRLPVTQQAGLSVNTTGLLDGDNAFSVEMVFQFEQNLTSWESILGVSNRQSDNAFYVEPGNHLQVFPTGGGPTIFTFGEYHHVTLTNDGAGTVTAYLDGIFQFDLNSSSMNFSSYVAQNPDRLIHFFADNVVGGGQGEFADGRVALIKLYDEELTEEEVGDLGDDPFTGVPAPGALLLLGFGLIGLSVRRRTN